MIHLLALLFLISELLFTPFSQLNYNPASRLAAAASFCNTGTFELKETLRWTHDWSQAPSGAFQSNKAPGPTLISLPFYCVVDKVGGLFLPKHWSWEQKSWKLRHVQQLVLSLLLQIIPWILLVLYGVRWLQKNNYSNQSQTVFTFLSFFGTTPAILMNVWMGHGVLAVVSLGLVFAILNKNLILTGILLSLTQLTEYSSMLAFPGFIFLMKLSGFRKPDYLKMSMAFLPLILIYGIYHQFTFGSYWVTAAQFVNPEFSFHSATKIQLWGVLSLPSFSLMYELLFGMKRGILFSQPWVLMIITFLLFRVMARKSISVFQKNFLIISLLILSPLLLFNASFGGWHGGGTPGPRYLSLGLSLYPFLAALTWDSLKRREQQLLFFGFGFSFIVYLLAKIFTPTMGMWPEWSTALQTQVSGEAKTKAILALVVLLVFGWAAFRLNLKREKDVI